MADREIEKLWDKFIDIPFNEDEDGELVLAEAWSGFEKGTDRVSIWHWFDEQHSKGVGWLMDEYERERY
jgi:hypothetical protein